MGKSREIADYQEATYTPTVTAGSGTITAYTASGRYIKQGKHIHVQILVSISNNGTGAGLIQVTLPFAVANNSQAPVGCGREDAVTGKMLQVRGIANTSNATVYTYDNVYPGDAGHSLLLSMDYISA
jgi:hypothetical protein